MLFVTHQEVALSNKGLFSEKPLNDKRFLVGLDLPGSLASSLLTWIVHLDEWACRSTSKFKVKIWGFERDQVGDVQIKLSYRKLTFIIKSNDIPQLNNMSLKKKNMRSPSDRSVFEQVGRCRCHWHETQVILSQAQTEDLQGIFKYEPNVDLFPWYVSASTVSQRKWKRSNENTKYFLIAESLKTMPLIVSK